MNNTKELYKSFSIYLKESKLQKLTGIILSNKLKKAFNYLRQQKELENYADELLINIIANFSKNHHIFFNTRTNKEFLKRKEIKYSETTLDFQQNKEFKLNIPAKYILRGVFAHE